MSDETMTTPADAALLREMAEGEVYDYTLGIDVPAYDDHTRARLRALADVLDKVKPAHRDTVFGFIQYVRDHRAAMPQELACADDALSIITALLPDA